MPLDDVIDLTLERIRRGRSIPLHDDPLAVVVLHRDGSATVWNSDDLDQSSPHNEEIVVSQLAKAGRAIMGRE